MAAIIEKAKDPGVILGALDLGLIVGTYTLLSRRITELETRMEKSERLNEQAIKLLSEVKTNNSSQDTQIKELLKKFQEVKVDVEKISDQEEIYDQDIQQIYEAVNDSGALQGKIERISEREPKSFIKPQQKSLNVKLPLNGRKKKSDDEDLDDIVRSSRN